MKNNKVIIYSDGSCLGNPGKGGWAAILMYNEHYKEIFGSDPDTTNNKMELRAVIEALRTLKKPCEIDLYTDSQYVKNGMTEWIRKWKTNGWKGAANKDVKNVDLWQELDLLASNHKINWHWVKAHDINELNNKVDKLARNAAESR